jgi:hypothetical protein
MYGIAEIAIECRRIIMRARIRFPLYVAGRRVKVVPRYALGFHLDPPPGSGAFPFRISRGEECLPKNCGESCHQVSHAEADEGNRQTVC